MNFVIFPGTDFLAGYSGGLGMVWAFNMDVWSKLILILKRTKNGYGEFEFNIFQKAKFY